MRRIRADALEDEKVVPWPSEANPLLPCLARYLVVAPDDFYVCGKCHKSYNAAVFDALECRCYEINTLEGIVFGDFG